MQLLPPCFIPFEESVNNQDLPEKFTFPFYYQPHALSLLAAKQLQKYLVNQQQWQHNFGAPMSYQADILPPIGKMFGVLVVKTSAGELGYLSAYSGKLADSNDVGRFVPPVFDMLTKDSFFLEQQVAINALNEQLLTCESNPEFAELSHRINVEKQTAEAAFEQQRALMIEGRKKRKLDRANLTHLADQREQERLLDQLNKASVAEKNHLKHLKHYWGEKLTKLENALAEQTQAIDQIKLKRKMLSAKLQQQLFEQYRFLNGLGEYKNLAQLFEQTPPAGAGECAAPKLLHYAYLHHLRPIAMAEFWWGASPKAALRRHGNFYPACLSKCQPILEHMLTGLVVDDNPMLENTAEGKLLPIIYQDDSLVVVNKPAEFLSVPGKNVEDSVYLRIKQQFPEATGPLIVHRLDMSTSGLMVIALTKVAHKNLQKQFIKRTVEKRYVALLDGVLTDFQGKINLPLRVDLNDRPRQLVCEKHGKAAETHWQLIAIEENKTRVFFYPKTGRTHQLRVHAAHVLGLNCPIVGDDHYGTCAERLHLHAQTLTFLHPVTNKVMEFDIKPEF